MKRIISLLLALTLLLGVMPTAFAVETGYKVTFAADEHATVDVYNTQDYTTPSSTNVTAPRHDVIAVRGIVAHNGAILRQCVPLFQNPDYRLTTNAQR